MNELRKAAEMALSFIDLLRSRKGFTRAEILLHDLTIEALRQAIAMEKFSKINQEIEETLKQPKRKWVGLTDEEISEVLGGDIHDEPSGELKFIRAIEAKLKEKNT